MIDAHHDRACATGARIVHASGFDSIPSDLGTWALQQEMIGAFEKGDVRPGKTYDGIALDEAPPGPEAQGRSELSSRWTSSRRKP